MTIYDFQIGDWASFSELRTPGNFSQCKVAGLDEEKNYVLFKYNKTWGYYAHPRLDKIEPIQITEKMLLANGWTKNEALQAYWLNGNDLLFEWYINRRALFINDGLIPVPVQYVHQLQHAFRLCGLTDMADEFKIE